MTLETASATAAPSLRRRGAWAVLVVAVAAILAAGIFERVLRTPPPPRLRHLPEFALRNRDGAVVSNRELAGAPWIADFIFTHCQISCPMMTARMARLDHEVPRQPTLRLVSISVDPERDTPAVLARYATQFGASPRWLFLTGDQDAIVRLSRDGFALGISGAGSPGEPITHSSRFILVDGAGWIRGYYDALNAGSLQKLRADAAALAGER
jgi:protein SCO1/2